MPEKKLHVPKMPSQRGPCCGLYALVAVAKALDSKTYSNLYATAGDSRTFLNNVWSFITCGFSTTPTSLRHEAKKLPVGVNQTPVTLIGEIFSSDRMVALAQHIKLNASILRADANFETNIKTAIDSNHYILAPFGVDNNGLPQTTGASPHWCIIYGYNTPDINGSLNKPILTSKIVYTTHWGELYEFSLNNLKESSNNLQKFTQTWYKKGNNLNYKKLKGQNTGNKQTFNFDEDLPNNLAGQFVEVWL